MADDDFVSQDDLTAMTKAAVFGKPYTPPTATHARTFAAIQRDVAKIKADGGEVEIPFDFP